MIATSRIISTANGRKIRIIEAGQQDGLPVVVHHGTPGSSLLLHKRQIFISDALLKECIALEETEDGIWSVYFYNIFLARLDEQDYKLHPGAPKNV